MKRVNYDEVSAVYDRRYQAGGPAGIVESLREVARTVNARRVVEVGCGTGHWLASLPEYEVRCGLDYSAGMLSKARHKDGSVALVRGTAMHLPFPAGAFDMVFCVHALHHFDDPPAFIHEARRVLRAGGALAIVGIDPQTEQDRWYVYETFPGTYETDVGRYPPGPSIVRWMKEAGLARCERRLAARIVREFVGREVLSDPVLHKNGTSQFSLLTEEAFLDGMARIREAVESAERRGEEIVFRTDIACPLVVGFAGDAEGRNTDARD